jgi:UDP-glucose 4-epimerase
VLAAFTPEAENQVFNVGADTPYTVNALSSAILTSFFPGGVPRAMQPKYLPSRPQEVKDAYSSHHKARRMLGYRPATSLDEGIAQMVAWAKSVGPQRFTYLDSLELDHPDAPVTWKRKLI